MIDSAKASTTAVEPRDETAVVAPEPISVVVVPVANEPPCELPRRFGLQPRDQLFVGMLAAVMLSLSAVHAYKASRWSLQPVEISRQPDRVWTYRLDINTANWVEWMQLDDIGERIAVRIVEDRETNGPFESIEDLDRVNGIGPKTIEKLRPYLKCETME